MKKAILALLLLLVGCGNQTANQAAQTPKKSLYSDWESVETGAVLSLGGGSLRLAKVHISMVFKNGGECIGTVYFPSDEDGTGDEMFFSVEKSFGVDDMSDDVCKLMDGYHTLTRIEGEMIKICDSKEICAVFK